PLTVVLIANLSSVGSRMLRLPQRKMRYVWTVRAQQLMLMTPSNLSRYDLASFSTEIFLSGNVKASLTSHSGLKPFTRQAGER
ncbi:1477_t:CDS:1, partial [Paraglomus brasilianum]